MKSIQYRSYFLALLILCSSSLYSFDKAEESLITRENIPLLIGIIATIGGIFFVAGKVVDKYETQIIKWLNSVLCFTKKNPGDKASKDDEDFDFSEREKENDPLEEKIKKNKRQKSDQITPLHIACHENDIKKVQSLVGNISTQELNAKYHYHRTFKWRSFSKTRQKTALFMACEKQNVEIVDALLAREDIEVNVCCCSDYSEITALYIACDKGNLSIVQKLLQNKNIDINKGRENPLDCVYRKMFHNKSAQYKDIFFLLLQQDAIDPTGALALACLYNDMDMFNRLMRHKNTEKFLKNNNALYGACKNGNVEMVQALLKLNENNCMDINALVHDPRFYTKIPYEQEQSYNPLHIACKRAAIATDKKNYIEIIKLLLLEPRVDVTKGTAERAYGEQNSGRGFTALHLVATDETLLRLLLEKDCASINTLARALQNRKNKRWPWLYVIRDEKRRGSSTPLYVAIKAGKLECVKLLLAYGADMTIESDGHTIFELACEKMSNDFSFHSIVDALISHLPANTTMCFSRALGLAIPEGELVNEQALQLLLKHTNPSEKIPHLYADKNHFSLPILKAARKNLTVLNMFINQYKGNCSLHNHRGNTPLFIAFMAEKITDFCEIDYFKTLNLVERKQLMEQELDLIAQSNSIRRAKIINKGNYLRAKKDIEKNIKQFNLFVEKCIKFGDIHASKVDSLIPEVYSQMVGIIHNNRCQYSRPVCCCNYKEVVAHAFLLHATDREDKDQKIDQKTARAYKDNPLEYYSKGDWEKKEIKEYFA